MLVRERMTKNPIVVPPDMPITEALNLMHEKRIRRTPVIDNGKLVGIISEKDLLNASPSDATSLSVWELNYLINKILVRDVMTKDVITVEEDTAIEEAARIMVDNKIGGLPVMRDGELVGIITETDLFKIFIELMGARDHGVRVTVVVPNVKGELAKLTKAIADIGGNFEAFGQFAGDDPSTRNVTFKVKGEDVEGIRKAIEPYVKEIVDIRVCC